MKIKITNYLQYKKPQNKLMSCGLTNESPLHRCKNKTLIKNATFAFYSLSGRLRKVIQISNRYQIHEYNATKAEGKGYHSKWAIGLLYKLTLIS